MAPVAPPPATYSFPSMTEEELRQARLRAFWTAALIATVPYFIHVAWNSHDAFNPTMYYKGVPDLAFAGVLIAIAAFSNTIFAFVTLAGAPKSLGLWTYVLGIFVAFSSLGCFIQYLRAVHTPFQSLDFSELFLTALMFATSTLFCSLVLQFCFLSDECRWARRSLAKSVGL